jgi:anti-sigma factor RsiW
MSLCKSIATVAMAYLDDELASEERRELELHVAECASCRAHLDAERAEQAALHRALAAPPAPDLLRAKLGRALDAEDAAAAKAGRKRWARWMLPGSAIAAAAAAIALFVAGQMPAEHTAAVVDEAVRQQSRTLPMEVQGPGTGPWLRQNFASLELPQVREAQSQPIGARLLPHGVNGHDAALVQWQLEWRGRPFLLSMVAIQDVRDGELAEGDEVDVEGRVLHVVEEDGRVAVTFVDGNHVGYAFIAPELSANELVWVVGHMNR